jgi:hypothetical protein
VQLTIPIVEGKLALGTWQGIYFSNMGVRRIGDRLPCILLENDLGRIDHRPEALSPAAVLAKSRGANAFRFRWMKVQ